MAGTSTTVQERKHWILEAQSLLVSQSDAAVIKVFVERHGIPQRRAQRYVEAARRAWNLQRIHKTRDHRMARALARVDKAAEIAVNHHRHVVVDGQLERVPEPDAKALLAAVETEAKLLGLNPPERREVVISTFDVVSAELVAVMHRELVDPLPPAAELKRRLARGFRAAMEAGARSMKDAKLVDANVIEKSTSPSIEREKRESASNFAPQSEPHPPGTNGTAQP